MLDTRERDPVAAARPPDRVEVTIVSGGRFLETPDGELWAERSSPYTYEFWARYLGVYDGVCLVVRAKKVDEPPNDAGRVTGARVRAETITDFHTPAELVARAGTELRSLKRRVDRAQALHLQVPSPLANVVYLLMDRSRPFAVEVKGDPFDSLAPGAFPHPARPLYRWTARGLLTHQCAHAAAIAYVTERALQRRYPPTRARFATHFSNVVLPDKAFVAEPRAFEHTPRPARLLCVGMLKQLNKAPDIIISAVAECVRRGYDVQLSIAGDGPMRPSLEAQARREGVGDRVRFLGLLKSGREVRDELDRSDLFVMPSRQEGVPRAALEAMARSLPCIGSTVGGFPEILPAEVLVPRDDVPALAGRIAAMLDDPGRMTAHARRNLTRARDFHEHELARRRTEFFSAAMQISGPRRARAGAEAC